MMQMYGDINTLYIYHIGRERNVPNARRKTEQMADKHVDYLDAHDNKVNRLLLYTMSGKLKTNIISQPFIRHFLWEEPSDGTLYRLSKDDDLLPYSFKKCGWPDFSITNMAEYTLILYLALCDVSQSQHVTDKNKIKYYMIFGNHCFNYEAKRGNADTTPQIIKRNATEFLKHTIMTRDVLCKLNQTTANILFLMDDISSNVSSLGTELLNIVHSFVNENNWKVELENVMDEIDGRIGQIVSFLREHCDNYKTDLTKSPIHRALHSAAILKIVPYSIESAVTALITVEGGYTGYMKIILPAIFGDDNSKFRIQGAGEILGHWIDRIVGWYRSPVVVTRTLYLTEFNCSMWQPNGYDCKYEHVTSIMLPGMSEHNSEITYNHRKAVHYDIMKKSYFIIVCIVGKIKDVNFHNKYIFPKESKYMIMNEYLDHRITYNDLIHKGINITKQRIRDITDVHIADFINVNMDRIEVKNWILSGTRIILGDNGLSFTPFAPFGNDNLHCIPLFCQQSTVTNLRKDKIICRFNRDTITKLKKVGPKAKQAMKLGVQLQFLIKNNIELQFMINSNITFLNSKPHVVKFNLTTEESVNSRINYVLDIHNKCYNKYGTSIYI